MNENAGKIAIVNEAFLDQNKKSIYHSSSLEKDLNDISKIDDKYKINVSGVEYVIVCSQPIFGTQTIRKLGAY